MRKKSGIVVSLSGGMDSVTVLYDAVDKFREVHAVSFFYGQKHSKELEFAKKNAQKLDVPHTVIDISFLKNVASKSALLSSIDIPEGHYQHESMKQTVVPYRNLILSSVLAAYAANNGLSHIGLGIHSGDHAIYPDCRVEFLDSLRNTLKLGDYSQIDVYAPFVGSDKEGILRAGFELGVDYGDTWTCYKGEDLACGVCGSCQERLEAFAAVNMIDPVIYE